MAETVTDGFGSTWPPCEKHDCSLQVMRPGDARCPHCETEDYIDRLLQENSALRTRIGELERDKFLREAHTKMLANWGNVCESAVFQELKHGKYRDVLHALQDGAISVGKAAQTIAERAHCGEDSGMPPFTPTLSDDVSWKERAEAAESRLTQLEGALRLIRNLAMYENHHNELGHYVRIQRECDAALTPVVKQEPTK